MLGRARRPDLLLTLGRRLDAPLRHLGRWRHRDHRQPQLPRIVVVPRERDEVLGARRGANVGAARIAHAPKRGLDGGRREEETTRAAARGVVPELGLRPQKHLRHFAIDQLGSRQPLRTREAELARRSPFPVLLQRLHPEFDEQPLLPLEGQRDIDDVDDALPLGVSARLALLRIGTGGHERRQRPQLLHPRARVGRTRRAERRMVDGLGDTQRGLAHARFLGFARRFALDLASTFGLAFFGLSRRARLGVVRLVRGVGEDASAIAGHERGPEVFAVPVLLRVRAAAMHLEPTTGDGADLDANGDGPLHGGPDHGRIGVVDEHLIAPHVGIATGAERGGERNGDFFRDRHRGGARGTCKATDVMGQTGHVARADFDKARPKCPEIPNCPASSGPIWWYCRCRHSWGPAVHSNQPLTLRPSRLAHLPPPSRTLCTCPPPPPWGRRWP